MLYLVLTHKKLKDNGVILRLLELIVIFIVLSALPFYFEIMPVLGKGYSLDAYGGEDINGFIGLYQKPHGAATVLAYSAFSLIFLVLLNRKMINKIIYFLLFSVNVYLILNTYVRTGVAMLAIGLLILLFYKKSIKRVLYITPVFVFGLVFIFNQIQSNETYLNRIESKTQYNESQETNINNVSSGRIKIWETSIKSLLKNDNAFEILFGIGEEELKVRNHQAIGMAVFAHNGFINILCSNGFVGFFILLLFISKWFKIVRKSFLISLKKKSDMGYYAFAIFFIYITFMLFQGGPLIYESIFISLSIQMAININREYDLSRLAEYNKLVKKGD